MSRHGGWQSFARVVAASLFGVASLAGAQPVQFNAFIANGLNNPIGLVNAGDGSDRLFIVQKGGAIRVTHGATVNATPLVTVGGTSTCRLAPGQPTFQPGLTTGNERGLLGAAFHPEFVANGQVFLSYTDGNSDTLVVRYTMADPAVDVMTANDLATCTVVLRTDQDGANHKGGNIAFGPDGYLYLGFGDGGGGGGDPENTGGGDGCNRGQTLNPANLQANNNCAPDANFTGTGGNPDSRALLGKFLRIDIDATSPAGTPGLCGQASTTLVAQYAIPDENPGTPGNQGNPFADGSTANGCDEVWAYGFRNPWRWSFDRETGDLLIGDVGEGGVEEINFEPAGVEGRNYGWRCYEGDNVFGGGCNPLPAQTGPVIGYPHTGGRCSVTGGFRYRGPVEPAQGQYFYADYCSGQVWSSTESAGAWTPTGAAFQDFTNSVPSFGEGADGALYVINGSQVWRLDGPTGVIFTNGFE